MKKKRRRGEEKKKEEEKGGERKKEGKSLFLQGLYILSTCIVLSNPFDDLVSRRNYRHALFFLGLFFIALGFFPEALASGLVRGGDLKPVF